MARQSRIDWFTSQITARAAHPSKGMRTRSPQRRSLRFEPLEDRRLLTITVNTLVDENDGIGVGGISLRDAIAAAANFEIIGFDPSLFNSGPATISLTHGELLINKSLSISGPGAGDLTIDASGSDPTPNQNNGDGRRAFRIDDGNATLATTGIFGITITGGDTGGDGGAIENHEIFGMADCVVTGNAADDGGALYNRDGYMTLTRVTLRNNSSLDDGGAISNIAGRVTLMDCTLSGNTAGDSGGGIFNASDMGGLHNLAIKNSTLSGNTSGGFGGGLFNFSGIAVMEFSTVTENTAPAGLAGGVGTWGDTGTARTDVRSSIIAGNHANDVAHLTGAPTPANSFNSLGYNLIGTGTSLAKFNQTGDQTNILDPGLAPLSDNGGSTQTHPLFFNSPAIDAGNPAALAGFGGVPVNDQRGSSRVNDGNGDGTHRIDIGSFENAAFYFQVDTSADDDDGDYSSGNLSLREAIKLSNDSPTDDLILFDASLSGQTITLSMGHLLISGDVTIDASGLAGGLTIDASGNDPTPNNDGGGTRVLTVDNGVSYHSFVTLRGLTLTGADYANGGGAIYNLEQLTIEDCVLIDNAAQWGGGLYNDVEATVNVVRSTVSGNHAISPTLGGIGSGGGLYNDGGYMSIVDSVVTGNDSVSDAGGIRNAGFGSLYLLRSTASQNTAARTGGGIRSDEGDLRIKDSTIHGNNASESGGGIFNDFSTLEVRQSTIDGNTGLYGGGLYLGGNLSNVATVDNSTISGNTAFLGGGGIYNFQSTANIKYSTITDNHAKPGQGGGLATWSDPLTAATNVRSTIIAGNGDSDVFVDQLDFIAIYSQGYNLIGIGTGTSAFDQAGDQVGVTDPGLDQLADNGGHTRTHKLRSTSPAIDAGDPGLASGESVPLYDQRGPGFARIRDGNAAEDVVMDIGAFEVQEFIVGPELPGDYNGDHTVDAADYTVWRNTLGDEVENLFDGADGDGDGMIDPDDYGIWKSHFGESIMDGGGSGSGAADVVTTPESSANENEDPVASSLLISLPTRVFSRTSVFANPSQTNEAKNVNQDALIAWLAARPHQRTDGIDTDQDSNAGEATISDADSIVDALDVAFAALVD